MIVSSSVMVGKVLVGWIVHTPPHPEISNWIVSGPGLAFACSMAQRKEPVPLSAMLVTET